MRLVPKSAKKVFLALLALLFGFFSSFHDFTLFIEFQFMFNIIHFTFLFI